VNKAVLSVIQIRGLCMMGIVACRALTRLLPVREQKHL
jgi:hypothetical protein